MTEPEGATGGTSGAGGTGWGLAGFFAAALRPVFFAFFAVFRAPFFFAAPVLRAAFFAPFFLRAGAARRAFDFLVLDFFFRLFAMINPPDRFILPTHVAARGRGMRFP